MQPGFPPEAARCDARWSDAHDLLSTDGRPAYIETPSLAVVGDTLLLAGTPSFFWATTHTFDPAPGPSRADTVAYFDRLGRNFSNVGLALDRNMRASGIRFPARLRGLVERAAVARDSAGGVHLYWMNPQGDSTALWHARREGADWTVQERLLSTTRLLWQPGGGDVRAGVGGGRDVHVAVPFVRSGTGAGVAYLRTGASVSRTVLHFHGSRPTHASVLPYARDSVLIAFTATDVASVTHLFLIRASANDTAFPAERRIHSSAARFASFPRLFHESSANGGRFGVLWASAASSAGGADSLHVMLSSDGAMWTSPASVAHPARVGHLSSVTPAAGGIQGVTYSTRDGAPIVWFDWSDGAWQRVEPLPFADVASRPSLMSARSDSLLLMWGVERPSRFRAPEVQSAPASRYAWRVTSCP